MLLPLFVSSILNIYTPEIPAPTGPTNPGAPEGVEPILRSSTTPSTEEDKGDVPRGSTQRDN